MRAGTEPGTLEFDDARGVTWVTGTTAVAHRKGFRWFRAVGRRERRYELRNGEAADESIGSLRAQLHASIALKA